MTIDELQVLITANTDDLRREINKSNNVIAGLKKNAEKQNKGFLNSFKALKTGLVALGIGKVIKDSIQSGMDAIESDNLFAVSLGKNADAVRSWSDDVANALGLNAVELRKNTGVIYNMTSSMGLAEKQALSMSKGVTLLANDMASFYNLNTDEAFNKIRAGITGETEPLKALGILVDENTIKQVAYSEGIARNGAELTQQQKVLARYVAILKQTGNAQGDLARTMDSPANLFRRLTTEIKNCSQTLGSIFIPIIQTVVPYIISFVKVIGNALNGLATFLGVKSTSLSDETASASNNVGGLASSMSDANKNAKSMKQTLAGFDEITNLNMNQNNGDTSSSTIGGGLDFDLTDYDAGIDAIEDKTANIVSKIENMLGSINLEPLKTSLSGLKTSLEPITSNLFSGLQWGYENILKPLGQFTITELLPSFINVLAGAFDFLNAVIEKCKPAFQWLWDNFLSPIASWTGGVIVSILNSLGNMLKWCADNIDLVTGAVIGLSSAWLGFKGLSIIGTITQFVKYCGALSGTKGLGAVLASFKHLGAYLSGAWAKVAGVVTGGLTAIKGAIAGIASALGISVGAVVGIIAAIAAVAVGIYALITNWDSVKLFFTETLPSWWNTFKEWMLIAWQGVVTWFMELPTKLGELLTSVFTALQSWGTTIGNSIKMFFTETIPNVWNTFTTWLGELPAKIGYFLGECLATLVLWSANIINNIIEFFTVTIPSAWDNFTTWIGGLWTSLGTLLSSIWENVKQWSANVITGIVQFFTVTIPTKWQEFRTWLSNAWQGIVSWAKEIPSKLQKFFTETIPQKFEELIEYIKGLPTRFIEAGKNIVQGIVDGITQGWENLKTTWNNFIDGFIQGFKDKLGIHSPSTVFADMGGNITAGLEQGISGTAFDGLNVLSEEAVTNLKNSWQGIAGWFLENVTNPLQSVFTTFSTSMTTIFESITSMIKGQILLSISYMNVMIDCLQTAMNSVVKSVNSIIRSINATAEETGIYLPYAKTEKLARVEVPQLARGGIIDKPTIAMIGEAGKEAVVPLENNTEWLDKVASKFAIMIGAMNENSNNGGTFTSILNVNGRELASATIDDFNNEAIRRGFKPILQT